MSPAKDVYGGRYEVLGRAGAGGMAEVYRARDELLGREVALKVLSERFAHDSSFVERFRREAQSAANLSHPNVVSLYDYGSDDGSYFIVMEYIDGQALSDIISSEAPLLPERAADIASDVTGALQRAHSADLVHRDIKPGNIMITSTGQTKVTDFGIARALGHGEQTMTQTGMVIGTASYLSPEQAQGNPVDPRSDIYSLGCVLYEMLTGRVPFAGDTPLSIAYKHVREEAQPPSRLNSDVPAELDAIALKALAKNPDNRYASADEMREDLQRFLSGQKVLATPLLNEATTVAAPVGGTEVLRPTGSAYPAHERGGRGAGFWILLSLLILALFGLVAWALFNNLLDRSPTASARVQVPALVGEDVARARALLEERGLESAVSRRPSGREANIVLNQDPRPGVRVEEGSEVQLVVSSGAPQTEVPGLRGETVESATQLLQDAGLRLGNQEQQPSDEFDAGIVISQNPPPGERVDEDSAVNVVVSGGPQTVTVPSVIGATEDEARAELDAAGLGIDVATLPNDEFEEGTVFAQDPGEGAEVEPDTVVSVSISGGPEGTPLPDVTGQDAEDAESALEDELGVEVDQEEETDELCTQEPGAVCRSDPEPGTVVSEGDGVTLFVQPDPGD
ncbi:MAG: Stk1 family PASTA domain-containing Ser/Thr kinase [Actinomycetota bacterium]|nr:Stk1 family PASTA domain-containing Ser/Thr kinase [Actinomycetota bacterium]